MVTLGHSGQQTSVKCAEAVWNDKAVGVVHLKSPAFLFFTTDTYGFGPWSERGCIRCYCSSHTNNCTEAAGWLEASVVSRFSLTNTGAVSPRWTGIDVDANTTIVVADIPRLTVVDPR